MCTYKFNIHYCTYNAGSIFATELGIGRELVKGALSFFKSEDQRKRESIIAKYDELINRCHGTIAEIRSLIDE